MALQIRRGTNAERAAITPLQGELIFTTDTKQVFVGDGTTLGGVPAAAAAAGAETLNELTDVVLTSPSNGQVLKYNGTNWVNDVDATGGSSLASLDDVPGVVLTSPSNGQVLKFNGTNWVNDVDATGGSSIVSLDDVPGVVLTSPSSGQVLKFDGANWINDTDLNTGVGSVSLNDVTDVVLTSPSSGQVLKFDGANWINDADTDTNLVLSVNGQTGSVSLTTTDITEGTNEYFTTEKAQDAAASLLTNGSHTSISFSYDNANNRIDANVSAVGPFTITGLNGSVNTNNFNFYSTGGRIQFGDPISGNQGNVYIVRENFSTQFGQGFTFAQHHDTAFATDFTLYRTRGTSAVPIAVEIGDSLGDIVWSGFTGTSSRRSAQISVEVESAIGATSIPGKMVFYIAPTGGLASKAELTSAGVFKVDSLEGLGTTLSVTGNITTPNFLKLAIYADDAARDTAIPTPEQGMMILMQSGTTPAATNQMQYYNGTAWVSV